MVTNARSRFWPVLLLLTTMMLARAPSARPALSISMISVLGPVLQSIEFGDADFLQGLITEVGYAAGIYSYVTPFRRPVLSVYLVL